MLLPWAFYPLLLLANVGWLWCVRDLRQTARPPSLPRALLLTAALHALCFSMPPSCSDDLPRYVWEGLVQHAGHNPFLLEPRNPLLAGLAEQHRALWLGINNKAVAAAYPPAQQLLFWLVTALTTSPWAMKAVYALLDLGTFVVLWRALPGLRLPAHWALVHGLAPLVALEFAAEGHNDALAVLAMVGALGLLGAGRPRLAGAALGLGIAAKVLPILCLPFLWRRDRRVLVPCAVVYALLWSPYLTSSRAPFDALLRYGASWRANDGVFGVVLAATEHLQGWLKGLGVPWNEGRGAWSFLAHGPAHQVARWPMAVVLLGFLGWNWLRRAPLWPATAAALFGFLLLAPTVHPWYVAWLVPFLCVELRWPQLLWCVLAPLAYVTVPAWRWMRGWHEPLWARLLEYLPVWLTLTWSTLRCSAPARGAPPATGADTRASPSS